ncbi:hypothetical protein GLYMA_18G204750v4 [Glycine max]|nr:hypothetical protein GLYMA_18G204750v4 [Glycine max]
MQWVGVISPIRMAMAKYTAHTAISLHYITRELRSLHGVGMSPGGMFVQRREAAAAADNGSAAGNDNMTTVMVTVAHHSSHHHLYLPTNSTFWDVKRLLVHRTGL